MSARIFRFIAFSSSVCSCLVVNPSPLSATELVLRRVPPLTVEQAPAYPENVARYHFGAQVEAAPQSNPVPTLQLSSKTEDANTSEAALLCDDPTVGYALGNGTTTLLISLSRIENIDSVSFLNRGSKGEVTISVSNVKLAANSPQWRQVSQQMLLDDAVKAPVGPTEAKYLKLTFNVDGPGRIAGLGVYSPPTVATFTMPRLRKSSATGRPTSLALISYNLTDVHTKARALYVTSGDDLKQANNMIDDQSATTYAFAANDPAPTAVIDLGKTSMLRRISAIYSPRKGNIDFFVLQSFPGSHNSNAAVKEALPRTLRINEIALANMKHVGSVSNGTGRAAVDFPETAGRYIVLKWTPAIQEDASFSIAEIAAFGGNKNSGLLAANTVTTNEQQTESDGKTVQDAKDLGEGKDIPSEGAETPAEGPPPGLPDPPPFTFVPEIVPTSP